MGAEQLVAICLRREVAAAGDVVAGFEIPVGAKLVGLSGSLDAVTGSPSAVTIDVNDDGAGITGFTAVGLGATAGVCTQVKTTHLGGAVAVPAEIAAGSEIDIDVNITGGSTPTAGVTVVLWFLLGVC